MKLNSVLKFGFANLIIMSAMNANAGITSFDSEYGKFSIDGDVEFDINYQNHKSDDVTGVDNDFQMNQSGRILFNINSERQANEYTLKAKVSPAYGAGGNLFVDDIWFAIASNEGGELKVGHFEAYDLFPAGQDTFLEHYGHASDSLVADDQPYMYRAKEGRGRGNDGQLMYSHTFDNLYMEVATKFGKGSDFFKESTYHGQAVIDGNDILIVRPVIAYQFGNLKLAAGYETNLADDSALITVNGKKIDILDRNGYGVTGTYAEDDFYVNMSYSYMNAVDEDNMSYGVNVGYRDFCLGYIGSKNEITNNVTDGTFAGDVKVNSVYASYKFSNVLDVKDFSIYVGGYKSTADEKNVTLGAGQYADGKDDYGTRLRFKYLF